MHEKFVRAESKRETDRVALVSYIKKPLARPIQEASTYG